MEWNGKFYFEWPRWRGVVYSVDERAAKVGSVVFLPDETQLLLPRDPGGYIEVVENTTHLVAERFNVERIFDTNEESSCSFGGDWEPLIRLINAAAAVNTLFGVTLTAEEYRHLFANQEAEFEALKQKFSPRAASLLYLVEFDGDYSVELYRTGRCP